VTNLELIPKRKRYLIVNIVKYNPLTDAEFARWYAKRTEEGCNLVFCEPFEPSKVCRYFKWSRIPAFTALRIRLDEKNVL